MRGRMGRRAGCPSAMPNTFSMAPGYVSRYVKTHKLVPPKVDVFNMLEARMAALGTVNESFRAGRVWRQDARKAIRWPAGEEKAKLVFSSPPYLQVMKYGKMNWLRLWMLGQEPREVDAELFASASVPRYLDFMRQTLKSLRACVREDGYVCLVIGDVRRGAEQINLAQHVADELRGGHGVALAAHRG